MALIKELSHLDACKASPLWCHCHCRQVACNGLEVPPPPLLNNAKGFLDVQPGKQFPIPMSKFPILLLYNWKVVLKGSSLNLLFVWMSACLRCFSAVDYFSWKSCSFGWHAALTQMHRTVKWRESWGTNSENFRFNSKGGILSLRAEGWIETQIRNIPWLTHTNSLRSRSSESQWGESGMVVSNY